MIFCSNCFIDTEIKSIIEGINEHGQCNVCGKSKIKIYDTDKHSELTELFEEILNVYSPRNELPADFPEGETFLIKDALIQHWNIFQKNINPRQVYEIIVALCPEKYEECSKLFNEPVGIPQCVDSNYKQSYSLLKNYSWEDFKNDIMFNNRFHTNHINLSILNKFCGYLKKNYNAGEIFYRGRISSADGFDVNDMGAPNAQKSVNGRVNCAGIKCLYLADRAETVVKEVRAGAFDFISIGKFKLLKDITIVDLKRINEISPFFPNIDATEYAINREHLNKINDEMGKALRRSDNPIDYVPTQYVSDFIKSILNDDGEYTYSGIEYNSTICKNGYNLAIFDESLFKCVDVEIHSVKDIKYEIEQI